MIADARLEAAPLAVEEQRLGLHVTQDLQADRPQLGAPRLLLLLARGVCWWRGDECLTNCVGQLDGFLVKHWSGVSWLSRYFKLRKPLGLSGFSFSFFIARIF